MHEIHIPHLKVDTLVTVHVSKGISDRNGAPPMTATARVMSDAFGDPEDPQIWLELDCSQIGKLPQMYKISEIVGLVMRYDLVEVTRDGPNSVTATLRSQ